MVSPAPRPSGPAWPRAALRRPRYASSSALSAARAAKVARGATAKRATCRSRSASAESNGRVPAQPSTLSAPTASSCDGPKPVSQPLPALIGAAPAKASASITPPVSARHRKVRRAMIGCGTASVSAPPASGRPSASNRLPSSARKRSGPVEALASSTSQASGAGRSIELNYVDDSDRATQSAGAAVPGVRTRVAPACNRGQPINVMGPPFRMACALLGVGQACMGQTQQRSVRRLLHQVDLDQARSRRYHLAAVPAKAVGEAMHRNHLAEGAAGEACAGDIDEIEPAGLWLEPRLRSHPAEDLLRIGQESKHRGAGRRDMRLAADDERVLHRSPPLLVRCPSPSP